jgi:hypothetical protein
MPTPEAEQVEETREVLGLKSYSVTAELIEGVEEVQWTAQLADNETWAANRDKKVEIRNADGIYLDPNSFLGKLRNRSRRRFGLAAVGGNASDSDVQNYEDFGRISESTLRYF